VHLCFNNNNNSVRVRAGVTVCHAVLLPFPKKKMFFVTDRKKKCFSASAYLILMNGRMGRGA